MLNKTLKQISLFLVKATYITYSILQNTDGELKIGNVI